MRVLAAMKLTVADCGWRSITEDVESDASDGVKLGVDCFASRAMTKMPFRVRPIDPTGKSPKVCPPPRTKIFRLTCRANQRHDSARLTRSRGGGPVGTHD